ncbi:RNA polymerase sigma factor [Sphingobacterium corticis]|uniref:RNA polymerase sigma factor n=1 Tax=Sphingobacterium corticis TaxID=1812823 RepID=A0ABW5NKD7_9SPHI
MKLLFNLPPSGSEVERLNRGDEKSFETIYWTHHQKIYSNILKIVHIPQYAEEILQDVFISLWENRARLDKNSPVANWLFTVSFNKSMDFLRKKVREHLDFVDDFEGINVLGDDPKEQSDILEEQSRILEEAIAHLSPRKKEVFTLYRLDGQSKEQVAAKLNITKGSVSEYLKQANKSIKQYVEKNYACHYGSSISVLLYAKLYLEMVN